MWAALICDRALHPLRNAKRDLLASVLAEATAADIEIVVSYLGGSLRQRRTGLGWRCLQELPPPAEARQPGVIEVDAAFEAMAELAGPGSAGARTSRARDLFGRATEPEQASCAGWCFGELRQGALDALVQEGLAAGVRGAGGDRAPRGHAVVVHHRRPLRCWWPAALQALAAVGLPVGNADPADAGGQLLPT